MENTLKVGDKVIIARKINVQWAMWINYMNEEIWKTAIIKKISKKDYTCQLDIIWWVTPSWYYWSLKCLDKIITQNKDILFYGKYL